MVPADPTTVMVVDDDPFQRKILRAWLAASGWDVREAATVGEALEQLSDVQVALVDLRLGHEDGFQVARRLPDVLSSRTPAKPPALVAMSAEMSESVRARCRAAGFVHTMAKPFQRDNVLEIVRSLEGGVRAAGVSPPDAETPADAVPESLRQVPALAALWRLEQTSSEPELVPAVEGLRRAGQLLASAALDEVSRISQTVSAGAHGLAGAAGMLGCTRVEATSKALASHVRRQGVDPQARLLISVIENEVDLAVEELLRKIAVARSAA